MKSPGESARVHETINGSWSESVTRETGHATRQIANWAQPRSPRDSLPREREDHEEQAWEQPMVKPPISREHERGSRSEETEEFTEGGAEQASTNNS